MRRGRRTRRGAVVSFKTIVGTSGSPDYLEDKTAGKRFWPLFDPVTNPATTVGDVDLATAGRWCDDAGEAGCDGLHDEGAPAHYLCTRCFPEGDLAEAPDEDERAPDPEEEID